MSKKYAPTFNRIEEWGNTNGWPVRYRRFCRDVGESVPFGHFPTYKWVEFSVDFREGYFYLRDETLNEHVCRRWSIKSFYEILKLCYPEPER